MRTGKLIERPVPANPAIPTGNIARKAQVVAAEIVDDVIYTIVILRDDQVDRIAQRVVELLAKGHDSG
jgi:hypothetical protein